MITFLWHIKGRRMIDIAWATKSSCKAICGWSIGQLLHNWNDTPSITRQIGSEIGISTNRTHLYATTSLKINVQSKGDPFVLDCFSWINRIRSIVNWTRLPFIGSGGTHIWYSDPSQERKEITFSEFFCNGMSCESLNQVPQVQVILRESISVPCDDRPLTCGPSLLPCNGGPI